MKVKFSQGFTLIEVLVVVVILSILTVFGVQIVSSGSVERNLLQHGKILQSSIQYACDQATLQNIPYGVSFSESGYLYSQFIDQQWSEFDSQDLSLNRVFSDGSTFSVDIEGQKISLNEEFSKVPQIFCSSSGEISAFVITISDATNMHHYQIKTTSLWQFEGQWLDEFDG